MYIKQTKRTKLKSTMSREQLTILLVINNRKFPRQVHSFKYI